MKRQVRKLDEVQYRNKIWEILKEFKESKTMTYNEVTDKIIAIPTPGGQDEHDLEIID